jgi:16S rRNA (uracil1498-N3)-methyltransferase
MANSIFSSLITHHFFRTMARRRFHAPPSAFSVDHRSVRLASDEARHLRDVLRVPRGTEVYVFDGAGKEFQCQVEDSGRDFAQLSVVAEVQPARPESPLDLTLAVALLKGEKFDTVVQKATELGVTRILPVITERTDVRLRDGGEGAKRVARWQRIALEAAKQCGRARVPDVSEPLTSRSLLAALTGQAVSSGRTDVLRLFFSERGGESLAKTIQALSAHPQVVTALIGSEGGWTAEEITQASAAGWRVVTFGGRILRAETAAIAVAVLLQHLFGDLV